MNRSLFTITAYLQIAIATLLATGCAQTQPFFLNESPDLQYYLNSATQIEYPDVDVPSLPDTVETLPPLTIGNHDYQFMDLTLEECTSQALNNAKFFITTSGIAEQRQNVADQIISGSADQIGSVYDVAIQQSTTQSGPLTVDSNGNRSLPRGAIRSNQVGGVEDALSEFDAQVSGFISYGTTDRPRNVGDSSVTVAQATGADATQQLAISKRIGTGGSVTLREQIIYGRSNLPLGGPLGSSRRLSSDYTAILEAQIQHPLMRNRGALVNRIPVMLASLNEDISIAENEIQVRNLVRDVENAYWDLYVSYRNVAAAIVGRNSAMVTAQFARLALENGTGQKQDLAQAVQQYYQFRGQLESALAGSNIGNIQAGVYGAERRLRELTGITATDGRLIRPIDEPTLARMEYDWDETIATTLYMSAEIRQAKFELKQAELEVISAKNQILPELNLSLLYRWVGLGDSLGPSDSNGIRFANPGSSALAELTSGDYQEGVIRLDFSPAAVGARRELARIRNAQLRIAQRTDFIQDKERLQVHQVSDAVAKVHAHYQQLQSFAQEWQASEIEVDARQASYKGGREPVNVVLQSQQRRAQATAQYYRALGEYNKSLNYVDYLKGTSLANSNITLAEGPWNKKAYWDALERARERSAGRKHQYGVTRPGVMRTGPVRDEAFASQIIGNGTTSYGELLPPDGVILEGPNGQSMGLDLEPYRNPIEVNDEPLGDMGSSTGEFMNREADSTIQRIQDTPLEFVPPAPAPITPPATQNGGQLNQLIQPISYERRISDAPATEVEYAPAPVRRRALPQN